jgi:hypothetical protein
MPVTVDFLSELYRIAEGDELTIGRDADLAVDDNPFLHRRFLRISQTGRVWMLSNVGSQLAATLADQGGTMQAWLAPGAQIPLVFERSVVWFTAGPTTYEFGILLEDAPFNAVAPEAPPDGHTTYGGTSLTPDQRLLLVALSEPMLHRRVRGASQAPSSADAANRLGWTLTKFNRKLDNVCQKLTTLGVRGLHGGPDRLATDRKSRLVEYALAARLVKAEDLALLDPQAFEGHPGGPESEAKDQ